MSYDSRQLRWETAADVAELHFGSNQLNGSLGRDALRCCHRRQSFWTTGWKERCQTFALRTLYSLLMPLETICWDGAAVVLLVRFLRGWTW